MRIQELGNASLVSSTVAVDRGGYWELLVHAGHGVIGMAVPWYDNPHSVGFHVVPDSWGRRGNEEAAAVWFHPEFAQEIAALELPGPVLRSHDGLLLRQWFGQIPESQVHGMPDNTRTAE